MTHPSSESYELSRLHITGPLRHDTPICVILEIAHSLQIGLDWKEVGDPIYIERVVKSIMEYKQIIPIIKSDSKATHGFNPQDIPTLALFVNPNTEFTWKVKPLLEAFHHLCTFYKVDMPPLPIGDFIVGQKTMSTPLAYNACMLYRLCIYYGIRTARSSTIEQMAQAIRGLNQDTNVLREQMIITLRNLPQVALLNLLAAPEFRVAPSPNLRHPSTVPVHVPSLPLPREEHFPSNEKNPTLPSINPDSLSIKALTVAYQQLTNPSYTLPRIQPQSQEEAIMLAAVVYGINLTECSNPYEEFNAMRSANLGGVNQYIPVFDEVFQRRWLCNPIWFDVRRTWSARLPNIYETKHLHDFVLAEGYPVTELDTRSPEELLTMSRVTPTFYLGRHPDCRSSHTIINMVEISTIHPQLIITYGIADGGPYSLYTVSELTACFSNSHSYTNPEKADELISTVAINKLRNIAKENTRQRRGEIKLRKGENPPVISTEIENAYLHLLAVMEEVDLYIKATSTAAKQLATYYMEGSTETKNDINDFLTRLLHMAYYMRGWHATKDHKDIPIARNKTNFPAADQGQVFINTERSIRDFEAAAGRLQPPLRSFVRTLPLMSIVHVRDDVTFQASTSADQGRTIFDRLNIVKDGTSTYACIRLSSCKFAASACYYMLACKLPAPFNPKQLADIS